jgi:hypothetical protein
MTIYMDRDPGQAEDNSRITMEPVKKNRKKDYPFYWLNQYLVLLCTKRDS